MDFETQFTDDNGNLFTLIKRNNDKYFYFKETSCAMCKDIYLIFSEEQCENGKFPFDYNFKFSDKVIAEKFWEEYKVHES